MKRVRVAGMVQNVIRYVQRVTSERTVRISVRRAKTVTSATGSMGSVPTAILAGLEIGTQFWPLY